MKTIILIAVTLFIFSYGRDNTSTIRVIDLLSAPESEIRNLSEIASDVEYIPLQTTENSLINNIRRIKTSENRIYIQLGLIEVMCFDKEGRFLYKLSKRGKGPEEYLSLLDFDVSSDNRTIVVLSRDKIMEFKNAGAEFVFSKSFNLKRTSPTSPTLFDRVPGTNNFLLSTDPITGSEPSLSVLIDNNYDTLNLKPNCYKYERENPGMTRAMANESLHYKVENTLCFKEEFSDTVFSITSKSNNFTPRIIFDSHGKSFPPRARYDREYALRNSGEFSWVYTVLEVPGYIIYSYEYNRIRRRMLYDKSLNKKFEIDLKNAFADDISGGPNFDPAFCGEGKLFSSIDAIVLKKYVAGEDFTKARIKDPKKKEELKALANKLNESDNPVLIEVTPKKQLKL